MPLTTTTATPAEKEHGAQARLAASGLSAASLSLCVEAISGGARGHRRICR